MDERKSRKLAQRYIKLQQNFTKDRANFSQIEKLLHKSFASKHFQSFLLFEEQRRDGWGSKEAIIKAAKDDLGISIEEREYGIFNDPVKAFYIEKAFFEKSKKFFEYQKSPKGWLSIPFSIEEWAGYLKSQELLIDNA